MLAHVTRYEFRPGLAEGVLVQAEQRLVPRLRHYAGIHSREAIRTAPDHALVISRWNRRRRPFAR